MASPSSIDFASLSLDDLKARQDEQGQHVRKLKGDKAPKEEIDAAVKVLLDIKKHVAEKEAASAPPAEEKTQVVDAYNVSAGDEGVDYTKLVREFGTRLIDDALLNEMKDIISPHPLHVFLRRGLFFSHRDFDRVLRLKREGKPFYLYTGRGPSSDSLHLGHVMPFMFTKYLQDVFDVPLVVQMTDDEKFLVKDLSYEEVNRMLIENVKDIIACGLDPNKTFIFNNLDYIGTMYPQVVKIQKKITHTTIANMFGFANEDNIGKWGFPAFQAAPAFSASFPQIFNGRKDIHCLIPCGIDQDPFFRLTRDIAEKPGLKGKKCALLHSKFLPALQGANSKMSASATASAIYMSDTPKQIKNKINKYAFSGGGATLEEHREKGGNTDVDVPYQYLKVFLDDDAELARIKKEYEAGTMSTGEIKKILIDCLTEIVTEHQKKRAEITDDTIKLFMTPRKLAYDYEAPPVQNNKKKQKNKKN
eukprot:TRINITY_DN17069_c0_g1_i2.p1 TRINITY_DN17069_c0_g1~~TRINITY_DN17069_c0_g1_i2.p1  ORF type:complete len:475 (+),score=168.88 TRINITY_DN17069_c0_g1_i2:177-1601(+)